MFLEKECNIDVDNALAFLNRNQKLEILGAMLKIVHLVSRKKYDPNQPPNSEYNQQLLNQTKKAIQQRIYFTDPKDKSSIKITPLIFIPNTDNVNWTIVKIYNHQYKAGTDTDPFSLPSLTLTYINSLLSAFQIKKKNHYRFIKPQSNSVRTHGFGPWTSSM